jgi:hypothetical protein
VGVDRSRALVEILVEARGARAKKMRDSPDASAPQRLFALLTGAS